MLDVFGRTENKPSNPELARKQNYPDAITTTHGDQ